MIIGEVFEEEEAWCGAIPQQPLCGFRAAAARLRGALEAFRLHGTTKLFWSARGGDHQREKRGRGLDMIIRIMVVRVTTHVIK